MKEEIAKLMYQYANLIDDKDIDSRWNGLTENEKARFYECYEEVSKRFNLLA